MGSRLEVCSGDPTYKCSFTSAIIQARAECDSLKTQVWRTEHCWAAVYSFPFILSCKGLHFLQSKIAMHNSNICSISYLVFYRKIRRVFQPAKLWWKDLFGSFIFDRFELKSICLFDSSWISRHSFRRNCSMRAGLRMGNSWFKYRDVLQDSSKVSTLGQFPFGVSYYITSFWLGPNPFMYRLQKLR